MGTAAGAADVYIATPWFFDVSNAVRTYDGPPRPTFAAKGDVAAPALRERAMPLRKYYRPAPYNGPLTDPSPIASFPRELRSAKVSAEIVQFVFVEVVV